MSPAGDEAARRPGENLRKWAGDDRGGVRRFIDRMLGRDSRDPRLSGALGEELVAKELDKLGAGWTVLHGVRVGRVTDVDHLVIGPSGIFCLNTKRISSKAQVVVSSRRFLVNGYSRDYYPKAVRESSRVEVRLQAAIGIPVPVQPVLVLAGLDRRHVRFKEQPQDVAVVMRKEVTAWLRHQPSTLSQHLADLLVRKARQPETWDRSGVYAPPVGPLASASDAPAEAVPSAQGMQVRLHSPSAEPTASPEVTPSLQGVRVVPWRRYGHHRLYVNDAHTGQRLGWRDEMTGDVHVEQGVDPSRVRAALLHGSHGSRSG